MRRLLTTTMAVVLATAAGTAGAQPGLEAAHEQQPPRRLPFSVLLTGNASFVPDDGYARFTTASPVSGVGLTVAYDVAAFADDGALSLGLGVRQEEMDRPVGQTAATLGLTTAFAEGRLRVPLLPWLFPHVRVSAGLTRGRVEVGGGRGLLSSDTTGAAGSVGAGLTFRSRPRRLGRGGLGFAFSVALEGGYTVGSALVFSLANESAGDAVNGDQPIPTVEVPIGDLPRQFPYASVTVGTHF